MKVDYSKFGFREDYDPENRTVKQEYVTYKGKEYFVSTVDLGIDHQFGEGEPLYYETMIFLKDSWADLYCDRYTTREEALKNHNEIIKNFKKGLMTGNLTKDIEPKYTQNNKAATTVTLAVNEGYGDKEIREYYKKQIEKKDKIIEQKDMEVKILMQEIERLKGE